MRPADDRAISATEPSPSTGRTLCRAHGVRRVRRLRSLARFRQRRERTDGTFVLSRRKPSARRALMLTIAKAVGELLMPLSVIVILLVVGLSLRRWRPRISNSLAWRAVSLLVVLSLPATRNFLRAQIENSAAPLGAIDGSLRNRA